MSLPQNLVALSDSQLDTIMTAAAPLPPDARGDSCKPSAAGSRPKTVVGDGTVCRVCRELQRSYFSGISFGRGGRTGIGKFA